jgi:hypothetical protein
MDIVARNGSAARVIAARVAGEPHGEILNYAFGRNRIILNHQHRTTGCATLEFHTTFFPAGHQAGRPNAGCRSDFDAL